MSFCKELMLYFKLQYPQIQRDSKATRRYTHLLLWLDNTEAPPILVWRWSRRRRGAKWEQLTFFISLNYVIQWTFDHAYSNVQTPGKWVWQLLETNPSVSISKVVLSAILQKHATASSRQVTNAPRYEFISSSSKVLITLSLTDNSSLRLYLGMCYKHTK